MLAKIAHDAAVAELLGLTAPSPSHLLARHQGKADGGQVCGKEVELAEQIAEKRAIAPKVVPFKDRA